MKLRSLSPDSLRAYARKQMADGMTPLDAARVALRDGDSVRNLNLIMDQLDLSLGVWETSEAADIVPRIQIMSARMRVLRQLIQTGQVSTYYQFYKRFGINVESLRACFRTRGGRAAAEMRKTAFRCFVTVLAEARSALELVAVMKETMAETIPGIDFFEQQANEARREVADAEVEIDEPPPSMYQ